MSRVPRTRTASANSNNSHLLTSPSALRSRVPRASIAAQTGSTPATIKRGGARGKRPFRQSILAGNYVELGLDEKAEMVRPPASAALQALFDVDLEEYDDENASMAQGWYDAYNKTKTMALSSALFLDSAALPAYSHFLSIPNSSVSTVFKLCNLTTFLWLIISSTPDRKTGMFDPKSRLNLDHAAEAFLKFVVAGSGAGGDEVGLNDAVLKMAVAIKCQAYLAHAARARGTPPDATGMFSTPLSDLLPAPSSSASSLSTANRSSSATFKRYQTSVIDKIVDSGYDLEALRQLWKWDDFVEDMRNYVESLTRVGDGEGLSLATESEASQSQSLQRDDEEVEYEFSGASGSEAEVGQLAGSRSTQRRSSPTRSDSVVARTLGVKLSPDKGSSDAGFDSQSINTAFADFLREGIEGTAADSVDEDADDETQPEYQALKGLMEEGLDDDDSDDEDESATSQRTPQRSARGRSQSEQTTIKKPSQPPSPYAVKFAQGGNLQKAPAGARAPSRFADQGKGERIDWDSQSQQATPAAAVRGPPPASKAPTPGPSQAKSKRAVDDPEVGRSARDSSVVEATDGHGDNGEELDPVPLGQDNDFGQDDFGGGDDEFEAEQAAERDMRERQVGQLNKGKGRAISNSVEGSGAESVVGSEVIVEKDQRVDNEDQGFGDTGTGGESEEDEQPAPRQEKSRKAAAGPSGSGSQKRKSAVGAQGSGKKPRREEPSPQKKKKPTPAHDSDSDDGDSSDDGPPPISQPKRRKAVAELSSDSESDEDGPPPVGPTPTTTNRYREGRNVAGGRIAWTREEEEVLRDEMQKNGCDWAGILRRRGPNGTIDDVLKNRKNVALKDKARNMKTALIRAGQPVPWELSAVTQVRPVVAPRQVPAMHSPKPNNAVSSQVLVTRNLKAFKSLASPIGTLQARFHQLLLQPEATALRAPFYACLAPVEGDKSQDEVLLEQLGQKPTVALIQGNADPASVINTASGVPFNDASTTSTYSLSTSAKSNGSSGRLWSKELAPDDVREVIFMPFGLHKTWEESDDSDEKGRVALMSLAVIIHETSHWLFERNKGQTPQDSLRNSKKPASEFEAMKAERKEDDISIHILARLLGAEFELLTFTDGTMDLIKLRLPAPHPPLLTPPQIQRLTSESIVSTIVDATPYGASRLHTVPSWKKKDVTGMGGEIVMIVVVEQTCSHGLCKVD